MNIKKNAKVCNCLLAVSHVVFIVFKLESFLKITCRHVRHLHSDRMNSLRDLFTDI